MGLVGMALVPSLKISSLEGSSTELSLQDLQSITRVGVDALGSLSQDGTQTTQEPCFVFGALLVIPGFGNLASPQGG